MLLSTVKPCGGQAIGTIKKVGIGSRVVYHARAGMMRQRPDLIPGPTCSSSTKMALSTST